MRSLAVLLVALTLVPGCNRAPADSTVQSFVPVTRYDPSRDAAVDLGDAIREAARTNRRVLIEVGGEWCSWCRRLDALFEREQDLAAFRDRHFVTVKINWSVENRNEDVLSRFPVDSRISPPVCPWT